MITTVYKIAWGDLPMPNGSLHNKEVDRVILNTVVFQ